MQEKVFRTTGRPTDSEPRPLPTSPRKFPFESVAAGSAEDWAVTAEQLLKGNEEDCGRELLAPGFGSAGARAGQRGCGRVGWRGGVPALLMIHLAPSRAQPNYPATMASAKTVCDAQPNSTVGGCPRSRGSKSVCVGAAFG